MEQEYRRLQDSVVAIAAELFRFRGVFEKVLSKMDLEEQKKYASQYVWFEKKVQKALVEAGLRIVSVEGEPYDPGVAATPLNIDEFEADDDLFVVKMIEPIIMRGDEVCKEGTVLLGRIEK